MIVSKLFSLSKLPFPYLKSGCNIGKVCLRVLVKMKRNYICKVLSRVSATMYVLSNREPRKIFIHVDVTTHTHTHTHIHIHS